MRQYFRDSVTGQLVYIDDPGSTYYNPPTQQGQQQSGPMGGAMQYMNNAKQGYDIYSKIGSNGGYGGPAAVAAIIAFQHALSNQTSKNRRFEGVQTDDIFSSNLGGAHFATEPWAAYAFDQGGFNVPTSGEKFDAAMENKDYGMAARRLPAAASHYLDPSTALTYDLLQDEKFGKVGPIISKVMMPWRWAMDLLD